jgi:hypothetical protein
MPCNQGEHLAGLIGAVKAITARTVARFPGLTARQLNWKPVPDRWSVTQCFHHLVTANNAFFPIFEEILSGKKKTTFWESLPWLPAIWGKVVINAVDSKSTRKRKAPRIFHPSSSSIDPAVIHRFIEQQNQLIRYMKATQSSPDSPSSSSPNGTPPTRA